MGCICKKPFQENNLEFEQNSNNFNNNENDENRNDDNTQNKYFSPVLNNNENENLQNTNINSNNNIEFNSNDNLKSVLKSNNNNNNLLNVNLNNFQNKLNELKKSSILDKKSSNEKICENYCKKIIEFINLIRTFPHEYADYISYCMKNILIENEKKVNKETKEEITIKKIIYKKNVKVALNKGEEAFKDAFNTLINIEPIEPLIEKEELKIDLPQNINEVKDSNYMRNNVLKKNNEGKELKLKFFLKI